MNANGMNTKRRVLLVSLVAVGLSLLAALWLGGASPSAPPEVPDLGEALLHMGPYQVGFKAETIQDPATERYIHLMIWYPTEDDVSNKSVAVYEQVIPDPGSPTGLTVLPFTITAADYAPFVEGRLVYEGVGVAPGPHPLVVHLPGGPRNPGIVHIYEGVKFASHGFIFVSVTHRPTPPAQLCARELDAKFVLDQLLSWNQTPENFFYSAFDPEAVFGGGHSVGARTVIARTSAEQLCGLPMETRLAGFAVKDTSSANLTLAQMQQNQTAAFLNLQFCSEPRAEVQRHLGSHPAALTLEGFTFDESEANHRLFTQGCLHYRANVNAGHQEEIDSLVPQLIPPFVPVECTNPTYVALAEVFARQTTKYNIAFFRTLMGEGGYQSVLAPGQATDPGVHLIQTAPESGAFCSQPGKKPGKKPLH
jgi:hypothetical protein